MAGLQTRTKIQTAWERIETLDALGHPRQSVVFYDAEGGVIPSWQVTLDTYCEAYGHLVASYHWAELAHRVTVARALLHGLLVPIAVAESHDAKLLAERVIVEKRLHGPMPNEYCHVCTPLREGDA